MLSAVRAALPAARAQVYTVPASLPVIRRYARAFAAAGFSRRVGYLPPMF